MNPMEASRTALGASLMRAVHSRLDSAPLLHDAWGDRLVPEAVRSAFLQGALDRMDADTRARALASPAAALDIGLRASAAYADVILRARYSEDMLEAAVQRGVCQYVIIGAGFDSFAYRRPTYASQLRIYEVDHPSTQALKRQRLSECGVPTTDAVQFVAADLAEEDLATALARSSFDPDQPTFFSWLGVTMYLTRDANLAALRGIAECAPAGSELVFTYVDEVLFSAAHPADAPFQNLKGQVASVREAFLSGFDPCVVGEQLRNAGFLLLEDLNGEQMVAKYDAAGVNGLRSAAAAHIVHARLIGGHRRTPT